MEDGLAMRNLKVYQKVRSKDGKREWTNLTIPSDEESNLRHQRFIGHIRCQVCNRLFRIMFDKPLPALWITGDPPLHNNCIGDTMLSISECENHYNVARIVSTCYDV
jgi:hypothetical protein